MCVSVSMCVCIHMHVFVAGAEEDFPLIGLTGSFIGKPLNVITHRSLILSWPVPPERNHLVFCLEVKTWLPCFKELIIKYLGQWFSRYGLWTPAASQDSFRDFRVKIIFLIIVRWRLPFSMWYLYWGCKSNHGSNCSCFSTNQCSGTKLYQRSLYSSLPYMYS